MSRPLNSRQERFCAFIAGGKSGSEAYRLAGWNSRNGSERASAAKLLAKDNIQFRIAELRKPLTRKLLLSKDRHREILRDIAEDTERPAMVRIRAIEIDAKLAGHFAPDQVVVETGPTTLDAVRERAKAMSSAMSRV